MNRDQRQEHNRRMLDLTYFTLRPKFAAVLRDLEAHGLSPLIDAAVWRSPAAQMKKYRDGVSKVKWSFHNATSRGGHPEAMSVDITDADLLWNSPLSFWLRLASSAQAHQLECGIYWGLNASRRSAITAAISTNTWNPGNISIGWDPAHIQVAGISLLSARFGKRP
jgi:hypothetical protein